MEYEHEILDAKVEDGKLIIHIKPFQLSAGVRMGINDDKIKEILSDYDPNYMDPEMIIPALRGKNIKLSTFQPSKREQRLKRKRNKRKRRKR